MLKESEEGHFFQHIVDHLAHPIFVKDRGFRFVFVNKAFCTLLGHARRDVIGKTDYDFFPKAECDFFRSKDEEMFNSGLPVDIVEEKLTDAASRVHTLTTTKVPMHDSSGKVTYLVGIIHDVTQLKIAEEQARTLAVEQAAHQRSQFLSKVSAALAESLDYESTLSTVCRLALPSLADCCMIATLDRGDEIRLTTVAHVSPEKEKWALEQLVPLWRPARNSVGPGGVIGNQQAEMQSHVDDLYFERLFDDKVLAESVRRSLPFRSLICVPLRMREGVPGALLLVSSEESRRIYSQESRELAIELGNRASTALENAERFCKSQEAIKAREEFLSIASHELNTPLTTLKLQLDYLRNHPVQEDKLKASLNAAVRQVDHLALLIKNLLGVSRLTQGQLQLELTEFDLVAWCRQIAEQFAPDLQHAGRVLEFKGADRLVGKWDSFRLEQVVTNLLSNAVKYGGNGKIFLEVSGKGGSAQIVVADQGMGISPEYLPKVFDRFERGSRRHDHTGLGLGLYISKQIVQAHGGTLEASSKAGEGSRFTMTVPLQAVTTP